jgi:hypothetical protein
VFEEGSAVTALKSLKDFANNIWCNNHLVCPDCGTVEAKKSVLRAALSRKVKHL